MRSTRRHRSVAGSPAFFAAALLFGCGGDATPPITPAPSPAVATEQLVPSTLSSWISTVAYPYQSGLAVSRTHGGRYAAYITTNVNTTSYAYLTQTVRADVFRGRRIRWSAWVRHTNLSSVNNGLWMRVDGPGVAVAFDNMFGRGITGTADWHAVSIVLDVPQNAIGITLGVLMNGEGSLFIDDAQLEIVSPSVLSTNTLTAPTPLGQDSAGTAATYAKSGSLPANLDFENPQSTGASPSEIPQQAVDWLAHNSTPLATTDPRASLTDLEPLRQMVGTAHVVGLGEGSHGTSQFFQMKHRILEYLVSEMGFNVFAIEATTPESNDLNQYVLNGVGDPKILLSRLYFWTWNTQEVLDLILWMRQWNSTAPPMRKVQFLGFDMQHGGASIDSVQAFVGRVDPANASLVAARYACLAPYRNHEEIRGTFGYANLPTSAKIDCAGTVQGVFDLVSSHRTAYEAASSPGVYQARLHDARLVQQYEAYLSSNTDFQNIRNAAMAENVGWIRDQAGPNAKIVLWAHNVHITRAGTAMGAVLRKMYGGDYVNLGFLLGAGSFNSVGFGSVASAANTPSAFPVSPISTGSLESAFAATQQPRLLVDARQLAFGGPGTTTLHGPISMRLLAEIYDPAQPASWITSVTLPDDFDLMIYLNSTTASTLLPFVYR